MTLLKIVLVFIILPSIILSQDFGQDLSFSFNVGYSQLNSEDINFATKSSGLNYDEIKGSLSISGKLIYKFNDSFSSFFSVGYSFMSNVSESSIPLVDEAGNEVDRIPFEGGYIVQIIPLSFGLLYTINIKTVSIGFGGGPEYYYSKISYEMDFKNSEFPVGSIIFKSFSYKDQKTIDNLCLFFLFRPEYKLYENISLNSEIGYRFSNLIDSKDLGLEYTGLFFNLGVEYYF